MKKYLFLIFVCFSCTSQPKAPKTTTFSGVAMTIPYKVIIGSNLNPESYELVQDIIAQVFEQVNQTYNNFNPESEISRINQLRSHENTSISKELYDIFQLTQQVVHDTEGLFDPTIAGLEKVWRQAQKEDRIPSEEELIDIKTAIGWNNLSYTPTSFTKSHSKTEIDLCGIAKGYAIDLLEKALIEAGYSNIFIEWGGEIKSHGSHPDNRLWTAMIMTPQEKPYSLLQLHNQAIATSGDYINYWEQTHQGDRYCHIYHPLSLTPIAIDENEISSVTVVGDSCAICDALATAVMNMSSKEEAEKWGKQFSSNNPNYSFWIFSKKRNPTALNKN